MIHSFRLLHLALLGSLAFSACTMPGTFVSYSQSQRRKTKEYQGATQDAKLSDALAFNYANSVASIFQARATGGRFTREASDTALAGTAAVTAASQTWSISKHSLGVLGLTGLGIVELRKIFDSKARATAYLEASQRIRYAMKDFRAYNLNAVDEHLLSPNGWTLANVTMANIQIVEMLLAGRLPSPHDLEQASEPMTPEGAVPTLKPGALPPNNIQAASLTGAPRRSAAEARLLASQLELNRMKEVSAAEMAAAKKARDDFNTRLPSLEEFAEGMQRVRDSMTNPTPEEKNKKWAAVIKDANLTGKIKGAGGAPPGFVDIQAYYEKVATPAEQKALSESVNMHAPKPVNPPSLPQGTTPPATTTPCA
ncbi:hypothetical protein [Prosthecobacter sp.]|uniref:hypothetical protein n=1 Tax=Prosthecobacter sp. TaxID=1965333 RepID=UPI00378510D1